MALLCTDGALEGLWLGPELGTEVGDTLEYELGTRLGAPEGAFDATTVGESLGQD